MITKEQNIIKNCCFYASDFHLEMILVPYIKNKLNINHFIILTQNNLEDTLRILLDRININKSEKEEILNLGWNSNFLEKIFDLKMNKQKSDIEFIINGDKNFREYIKNILKRTIINKKLTIIECVKIEEINNSYKNILEDYNSILNVGKMYKW